MNINCKSVGICLMLVLIIILLLPAISSLGISPGRTSIDYESGLEKEVEITILNNEHKNIEVRLYSTLQDGLGTLTLFEDSLEFLPSEDKKTVRYKLAFPTEQTELKPGLHVGEIVAVQIPKFSEKDTFIGATVAVVSQLYVYVPCPGKCIEIGLDVLDAETNGTATFIVPVINRGKLGIGDARAIIDIYNLDFEKKATIQTDSLSIEPGARTELSAKWNVDLNSGNYLAKVTVIYDGESKNFEKEFSVGDKLLEIESIFVNDFRLGEIAKLQILVENRWNQDLEDVFANLLVFNDRDQVMADIKTASENVPSLSKKTLVAYWDTVGVEEGEYDGKLLVKYGKKSTDKNLILKITEDSLDIFGVGYTIQPKGGKGFDVTTILLVVIILLILINVSWFIFFRRLKEKK